jgi:hypothetical protein
MLENAFFDRVGLKGPMTPEQYQRSYLLPPGCKDLIDVLRLQELVQDAGLPPLHSGQAAITGAETFSKVWKLDKTKLKAKPAVSLPDPGFFLEVQLGERVTVQFLVSVLGRKPVQILSDLMDLGVFVSEDATINFEDAAKVLRKYGLKARQRKGP